MKQNLGNKIKFRTKNPKQLQAAKYWIDNETEELVYGGAKYGGKSYFGASMIFGDALIYPETNYFIAREELGDLRKFTIPSIYEVFKHWGLILSDYATFDGQYNIFKLLNGSLVYLIACKELPSDPLYERFGSMQMTRGWIEEAGEVAMAAKRNLALSIGRWNNEKYGLKKKLLMTCNPKKGWLRWDYIDIWLKGELPKEKKFVQAFATDNLHGDKDYIEALRNERDKVTRQRLWEGKWDYDENTLSLFKYSSLVDVFSNTITKTNENYLIIDVADDGTDKTIFNFFHGLESYRIEIFERLNTESIIAQTREYQASDRIPMSNTLVDAIGVGAGVASASLLDGIVGFKSSYQAIKTDENPVMLPNVHYLTKAPSLVSDYKNLRSQCVFTLAELVNTHELSCTVKDVRIKEKIIEELSLYQDASLGDSKRMATQKENIKDILGRSPDISDTFIMRMYFETRERMSPMTNEEQQRLNREMQDRMNMIKHRQTLNQTR